MAYVAVSPSSVGSTYRPTLGSRRTDTLSGLGPAPLVPGDVLPIGTPAATFPAAALAPQPRPAQHVALAALPGPRADWFTEEALASLYTSRYQVSQHTDRIGMRLIGSPLTRRHDRELVSEPTVAGALQVPPDGQPILFLADHPVTGGYPVVAVVDYVDIAGAAQLRPGQYVSFTPPGRFAAW
jgi:allophanate hydrolase subunit 2